MNSLLQAIARTAEQDPLRDALIGDTSRFSYQALIDASSDLSRQILDNNIGTLALIADNGPEWVVVDLACQMANCCFIPLPIFFSTDQIRHSIAQAGVDTLLVGKNMPVPRYLDQALEGFAESFKAYRLPVSIDVSKPAETRKITFTSGSTGTPKGVCLSTGQQLVVAGALASQIPIEQPRHLCVLPLATLLENIAGVYAPLMSAGTVYLPSLETLGFSGSSRLDPARLLHSIDHCSSHTMILIPQLLDVLINAVMQGWKVPASVQFIAVGGSRVAASAIQQSRRLGLPVYEGYGLSECASVVSLNIPGSDHPGSAGRVLPHIEVEVIDNEIHVVGNSFLGYLNDPESWYPSEVVTGDLGYVDESGFLRLQGRKKNLLISSYGRNISPEWVESEILTHPGIQQCVVVGDARPYCSALIYADSSHLSDDEIQQWLDRVNSTLPDYARVLSWLRIAQPLSSNEGLLTENGRTRRGAINDYYASAIDQLYDDSQENSA
ncbi:MAG: AMP-binding protein [Gammaproteobacteria bacterium]|jgi:long-subunit acyl-CoA synthetase (AMP-forming)